MVDALHLPMKRDSEKLVIGPNDFNGKKTATIRVYYIPEGEDDLKPTKRGVNINYEDLAEVIAKLQELDANHPE